MNPVAVLSCLLVASLEGVDIQSMGLAAPLVGPEFHLRPSQVGWVLSASLAGLLVGAAAGGWLADRISRRSVLVGACAFLGLFSLATTVTRDLPWLIGVRFLTGLGMGGAFPALIALTAESVALRSRATAISLMYCGMPLGGAAAGLLAAATAAAHGWRPVFYLGGFGPLLVIPLLLLGLPAAGAARAPERRLQAAEPAAAPGFGAALFGAGRGPATLLLWSGFFFTLLIVYLLLNWLPSLMVAKGLSKTQGFLCSSALNLGGIIGVVLLGVSLDRLPRRWVVGCAYLGNMLALSALAGLQAFAGVLPAALAAGIFALGSPLLLYALAPNYYPSALRGTGIGMAVSMGRLGSIAGPAMAGALLGAGFGAAGVLGAAVPSVLIGGAATLALLRQPDATTSGSLRGSG